MATVLACEYQSDLVDTTTDTARDRTAYMDREIMRTVRGLAVDMEMEMEAMGTRVMETVPMDTAIPKQAITIDLGPTDITDRLIHLFLAHTDSEFIARSRTVGNDLQNVERVRNRGR